MMGKIRNTKYEIRNAGYTFLELLVVITIMVLLGAGILLQQNLIKEDNALRGAASDVQSFIRLAQSNAQTGTLCEDQGSSSWIIEPRNNAGKTVLDLKCVLPNTNPPKLQTTFQFDQNMAIDSIKGNFSGGCNTNAPAQTLTIRFPTLSAKPSFENPSSNSCILSSTSLDFIVKNTKTNNTKTVTIDKGGTVDVN